MKNLIFHVLLICAFINPFILLSQENDSISIDILDLSFEELMKLKINTAGKSAEMLSEVPASVVIISKLEIDNHGFVNFEEILSHVTGLYITEDYNWLGTANFGVRGFYSSGLFNNIYILVNGVNQMEEYTGGTPLSKINIPIETIDRIEIVRGPMSVIYGSGAFLGAINIITNNEVTNEAVVSYGLNNSVNAHAVISKKAEDLLIKFSLGHDYSPGQDIPYTELTTNPQINGLSFLENNGLSNDARTNGQLSDSRTTIGVFIKTDQLQFDARINSVKAGIMDGQPTLGDGSYFIANSAIANAIYTKAFNKKLEISLKETYSQYNYYNNYEQDYLNTNMNSNQISSFFETEINAVYKPKYNLKFILGIYNRFIPIYKWGGDYSYWGTNFVNFLTTIEEPFSVSAIFLQSNLKFGNFTIVGGIRAEYLSPFTLLRTNDYVDSVIVRPYRYNQENVSVIPRIALIYNLNKSNTFKFFYGTAIKQPSMADLHPYCFHPDWETLSTSIIKTFEINYLSSISKFITSNFSLFYNHIDKLIARKDIFNPKTGELTIQSTSSGKMKSTGAELSIVIKPTDKLLIDLSGSVQSSKDMTEGMEKIELAYSPKFLGYGKISYLFKKRFSIAASVRYVDEMQSYYDNTSIDDSNPSLGKIGRIGTGSKAYIAINANFRIKEIWKIVYLDLKINNLFDTEIRYPTTTANAWIDRGAIGMGRMVYLSIGANFNGH